MTSPKMQGNFPQSPSPFDYVITVCGDARETCPTFTGKVTHRLHMGFEDPAMASGKEEEVLAVFRRVQEEIRERLGELN